MRHKGKIIVGIALMVIGIAIGYYLGFTSKTTKNFDWKELSIDQGGKGYGFTSDALFNSDIALPEIKKLSGKSKFIKAPQSGSNELTLGYIVPVDVDKLDLQKVPQKYKVEKTEKYKAGEFSVPPIEAVVYEVTFEFVLKDKDDFEIIKLKSPSHSLCSGQVNRFQDIAKPSTTQDIARRVSNIILSMSVEKCETCK